MDYELLGKNIRRLRNTMGFSQKKLAEASAISLPSIKLIESGNGCPRMGTVQAIATALEAKLQDLFVPVRGLNTVRFRSNRKMQNREKILADVSKWLDNFNFLEEITGERIDYKFKDFHKNYISDDIKEIAIQCRKLLGLRNDEPIRDISGLLENAGVKVFPISMASDGFFGLSVAEADEGPAIVVNSWERIPTERKIFSAAHELGHLIMHRKAFDVSKSEESEDEEAQANFFAGHFLMADDGFMKEWREAAGLHKVDRVLKVKRIFHVSYKTILARLVEYGVDDSIWKEFNIAYWRRFNKKLAYKEEPEGVSSEPAGLQRWDFYEDRFSRLVRKALELDKISLSRGAEILGICIDEMQDLLHDWEVVR